jgi:hypothetical protein
VATTFATALLRPVLEVAVKLDALLKKDAPHPALAGLPEVVVPLMSTTLQAVECWRTMTPPLDGWSWQDVGREMDRLRELRAAVDHASSELLKRHAKDERFPTEMLNRMVQAHRLNNQERFATAVHDCLAALAAWTPKQKGKGAPPQLTLAECKHVLEDWKLAKKQGEPLKVWAKQFALYADSAGCNVWKRIRKGHEIEDCRKLLNTCRKRLKRQTR